MSRYLKTNLNANFTQTSFTRTNYGIRNLNLDLTKWVNKSVWGEAARRKYHFESGKTSGCEWNLPYKHKEPAQTLAGHGGKHVLMAQVAIPGPLSTSTLLCLSSTVHTDCTGEVRYSLMMKPEQRTTGLSIQQINRLTVAYKINTYSIWTASDRSFLE